MSSVIEKIKNRLYRYIERFVVSSLGRFIFAKKMNYVVLESYPNFTGSPRALCEELKKRNLGGEYQFIWAVEKDCPNVGGFDTFICFDSAEKSLGFRERLHRLMILVNAKIILDSNRIIQKVNSSTFRIFVRHGGPLKKVDAYMKSIGPVDYILSLSEEIADLEFESLYPDVVKDRSQVLDFGLPANDQIFNGKDLYANGFWQRLCKDHYKGPFNKIIGWLPTYRQHMNKSLMTETNYPYGIPLLFKECDFEILNSYLKERNILLAVQLHHAQMKMLPVMSYSNIVIVSQQLKYEMDVVNADLMNAFDAMITDYSAAYHEFVLLDKPIALGIDDFDDYSKHIGFCLDYFKFVRGCYLKNVSDLLKFVDEVSNGIDSMKSERDTAKKLVHKYCDNKATIRVADFICQKAGL